jgi:hypothetical protein
MRTSHAVSEFGTYTYDTDVFAETMKLTVAQLRERVHGGCEGMESGTRTKVNRLRKADLAAMVAEWDTAARDNEKAADAQEAWDAEIRADLGMDEDTDREAIEFLKSVAQTLPESVQLPTTEIETGRHACVVQIGSRLYDGTMVSVTNRRTTFCQPTLAAVEVNGVRRLVSSDMLLCH